MNIQELAALLNGREYGDEITDEECDQAKQDGLVVVFGYSDDNVELRGAICDEISAYDGTTICFDENGILQNKCENRTCPHYIRLMNSAKKIEAIFSCGGYTWIYKTDIPHAAFDIMEDGDQFCKGIVFHMSSLK